MDTQRYRVCFFDEAPRIGSGWRTVNAMLGRKIAHLCDDYGNRTKMAKEKWRDIARTAIALPPRKRRRKRK